VGVGHALDAVHLHGPEQIEPNRARFGYSSGSGSGLGGLRVRRPVVASRPLSLWIRIAVNRKRGIGQGEMRLGKRFGCALRSLVVVGHFFFFDNWLWGT
jgi:hypothetical protein